MSANPIIRVNEKTQSLAVKNLLAWFRLMEYFAESNIFTGPASIRLAEVDWIMV